MLSRQALQRARMQHEGDFGQGIPFEQRLSGGYTRRERIHGELDADRADNVRRSSSIIAYDDWAVSDSDIAPSCSEVRLTPKDPPNSFEHLFCDLYIRREATCVWYRPCTLLLSTATFIICLSLGVALWWGLEQHDLPGGFTIGSYVLGAGVVPVALGGGIHATSCRCWKKMTDETMDIEMTQG